MKKPHLLILSLILFLMTISGCGNSQALDASKDQLHIVTTVFPEYDWVTNILGDNPADAKVTLLLDNGVDMHSFQPAVDDILMISDCDLFIYIGGESDKWVDDALKEAANKDMTVIKLMDVLGDAVKEEEITEGMQEEESGSDSENDEHIWLSLRNASKSVQAISDALTKADPENAEAYENNTNAYLNKLDSLDNEYINAVSGASVRTLVFGDRFPFRYLTDDYDILYYAAFPGCSAETEASFETITFLAGKVDELGLDAVMTIEGDDHRIAETIVQNTRTKDQNILSMDSMQSVTSSDIQNGATYLSIMEGNLEVIKKALSG